MFRYFMRNHKIDVVSFHFFAFRTLLYFTLHMKSLFFLSISFPLELVPFID